MNGVFSALQHPLYLLSTHVPLRQCSWCDVVTDRYLACTWNLMISMEMEDIK